MDTRPTVQAILMADTLIAHYLRAAAWVQQSLGRDEIAMAVQIGDANRTYASIWENLESARSGLLAEGRDVSAYDRLRAGARHAVVGVDTERSEIVGSPFTHEAQTLTVRLNLEGARRAAQASAALKLAVPDADWHTLGRQAAVPAVDLTPRTGGWWVLVGLAAAMLLVILLLR
jgi:hypothetical protein